MSVCVCMRARIWRRQQRRCAVVRLPVRGSASLLVRLLPARLSACISVYITAARRSTPPPLPDVTALCSARGVMRAPEPLSPALIKAANARGGDRYVRETAGGCRPNGRRSTNSMVPSSSRGKEGSFGRTGLAGFTVRRSCSLSPLRYRNNNAGFCSTACFVNLTTAKVDGDEGRAAWPVPFGGDPRRGFSRNSPMQGYSNMYWEPSR